jgi:hypothetical protein
MAGMASAGAPAAPAAPLFVDGRPLARYLADVRCGTLLLEGKVTEEHVIAVAGLLACDTKFTQLFLTRTGCTDRGACECASAQDRDRATHACGMGSCAVFSGAALRWGRACSLLHFGTVPHNAPGRPAVAD